MPVEIKVATLELKDRILELLSRFDPAAAPDASRLWTGLLEYRWSVSDKCIGFVLLDGPKVVGFISTLFSEREIDGAKCRICNLSSWIVLPEYRGYSLKLLLRALGMPGVTFTVCTARPDLEPLFRGVGFQNLETETAHFFQAIYRPLPGWRAWWFRPKASATTNLDKIRKRLAGGELKLFEDHCQYRCGQLLLVDGAEHCHIIFTKTTGQRFPYTIMHHVSNPAFLMANLDLARICFLKFHGTLRFLSDGRFFAGYQSAALQRYAMKHPRLFKSKTLRPEQIDNLYSELVILDL